MRASGKHIFFSFCFLSVVRELLSLKARSPVSLGTGTEVSTAPWSMGKRLGACRDQKRRCRHRSYHGASLGDPKLVLYRTIQSIYCIFCLSRSCPLIMIGTRLSQASVGICRSAGSTRRRNTRHDSIDRPGPKALNLDTMKTCNTVVRRSWKTSIVEKKNLDAEIAR